MSEKKGVKSRTDITEKANKIRDVLDSHSERILTKGVKERRIHNAFTWIEKNKWALVVVLLIVFGTGLYIAFEKDWFYKAPEFEFNTSWIKNIRVEGDTNEKITVSQYDSMISCAAYKIGLEKDGLESTTTSVKKKCMDICKKYSQEFFRVNDKCGEYDCIICQCI